MARDADQLAALDSMAGWWRDSGVDLQGLRALVGRPRPEHVRDLLTRTEHAWDALYRAWLRDVEQLTDRSGLVEGYQWLRKLHGREQILKSQGQEGTYEQWVSYLDGFFGDFRSELGKVKNIVRPAPGANITSAVRKVAGPLPGAAQRRAAAQRKLASSPAAAASRSTGSAAKAPAKQNSAAASAAAAAGAGQSRTQPGKTSAAPQPKAATASVPVAQSPKPLPKPVTTKTQTGSAAAAGAAGTSTAAPSTDANLRAEAQRTLDLGARAHEEGYYFFELLKDSVARAPEAILTGIGGYVAFLVETERWIEALGNSKIKLSQALAQPGGLTAQAWTACRWELQYYVAVLAIHVDQGYDEGYQLPGVAFGPAGKHPAQYILDDSAADQWDADGLRQAIECLSWMDEAYQHAERVVSTARELRRTADGTYPCDAEPKGHAAHVRQLNATAVSRLNELASGQLCRSFPWPAAAQPGTPGLRITPAPSPRRMPWVCSPSLVQ